MKNFLNKPPQSDDITEYDNAHFKTYIMLLDAAADGADWKEVVGGIFGINPDDNPRACREMYDNHLARARWMTEVGYRKLLE
jgi:Uncharacterized conserved protein (DUF2285)